MNTSHIVFLFLFLAQSVFAQQMKLVLFMSESCPICKSVTSELRRIDEAYDDSLLKITAYFPSRNELGDESLERFGRKYKLKFALLPDSNFTNARLFNAKVTPEAVLIDASTNRIIYRGMIDDSFASIGKRRSVIQNHYLRDAIEAWRNGKTPVIKETQPVGCILQYP